MTENYAVTKLESEWIQKEVEPSKLEVDWNSKQFDDWITEEHLNKVYTKRLNILGKCASSETYREYYVEYCRDNWIEFIETWINLGDPRRKKIRIFPLVLFERQREYMYFIRNLYETGRSGVVEKSRDTGMSWCSCAIAVLVFLLHSNKDIGFVSNLERAVDVLGNLNSLLPKCQYMLENIPLKALFGTTFTRRLGIIENKTNGSTIQGSYGRTPFRGARLSMIFKDESAFFENPISTDSALSGASEVKIDISTPNGIGNPFYEKVHSGKLPKFRIHWREDPRKAETYKSKKIAEVGDTIFSMEYDLNYTIGQECSAIPYEWLLSCIDSFDSLNVFGKRSRYNALEGKVIMGYDPAEDSENEKNHAMAIVKGGYLLATDKWAGKGGVDTNVKKCYDLIEKYRVEDFRYDCIQNEEVGIQMNKIRTDHLYKCTISRFDSRTTDIKGSWTRWKSNKATFVNLRAYAWVCVRRMAERTHLMVTKQTDTKYHPNELLCIPSSNPDHMEIIKELSTPFLEMNDVGKQKVESKKDMKRRNVKSPHVADAFVMAFSKIIPKRKAKAVIAKMH